MPWYKDYKLENGVYSSASNEKSGYHCMVIYGWNKDGWLVHNSWGKTWGKKGKFTLPFDFKLAEAWAVTDNVIGEGDIIRPADNWFVKTFAPIINKVANFFRKLFKKI
jgi:C1A family cysteine protease